MKDDFLRLTIRKSSNIKRRAIYWTNDIDDFRLKTYRPRKYFFRNVYLIQENIPELNLEARYLELRTFRKVYRCYIDGEHY